MGWAVGLGVGVASNFSSIPHLHAYTPPNLPGSGEEQLAGRLSDCPSCKVPHELLSMFQGLQVWTPRFVTLSSRPPSPLHEAPNPEAMCWTPTQMLDKPKSPNLNVGEGNLLRDIAHIRRMILARSGGRGHLSGGQNKVQLLLTCLVELAFGDGHVVGRMTVALARYFLVWVLEPFLEDWRPNMQDEAGAERLLGGAPAKEVAESTINAIKDNDRACLSNSLT